MDFALKRSFSDHWTKYFSRSEEPLVFFYSDDGRYEEFVRPKPSPHEFACLIGQLGDVRRGDTVAFTRETIACFGGLRYTGYSADLRPEFRYFLSCGIPGRMEGERYKKTPELVDEILQAAPELKAEGRYLVFRPWGKVEESETPRAVVFFAAADALSGLFTLANFRRAQESGVICPFGSGCASIIGYPVLESRTAKPRAVLGLFDPSARPHIEPTHLTFAIPWATFREMIEDMDESFLITNTWEQVRRRLSGERAPK